MNKLYDSRLGDINRFEIDNSYALRSILNTHLRFINMVVQDLSVLFLVGLNKITRNDLNLSESDLIIKLASENMDTSQMYIVNKMMAQIVSKLPYDLKEKLYPEQKINLINRINKVLHLTKFTHEPLNFNDNLKHNIYTYDEAF